MLELQFKPIALLSVLSIAISIICSEIILLIVNMGVSNWAAAAVFHGFIAALLLVVLALKPQLNLSNSNRLSLLDKHPSLVYLPALLVLLISLLLVIIKAETPFKYSHISSKSFVTITLIPIVEEICYRLGLSGLLSKIGGQFWGGYFSILVFTTMHGLPSIDRIFNQQVGFFLGPFLLAIVCELIFTWSKQLFPAILLHMVCNSTGVIFSWAGGYWLNVFGFLYQ